MSIFIATSTVHDGSMKSPDRNYATVLPTRQAFLQKSTIDSADTTLIQVVYETNDFCRYFTLTDDNKGDGIIRPPTFAADALVVTKPHHALLLPLADCVGAVIHDPVRGVLMLSHLGRHNLEQHGGTKCINYLADKHNVDPTNVTVWLSPAAGKDAYPLFEFDNRSLHDIATEQLVDAGVPIANIDASSIDSATDSNYFSHSQFLAGKQQSDGRHAVAAVMRP